MQTTKQIERQAEAGAEALAKRADAIADKKRYETIKVKLSAYLEIAENLKSEFRSLRESSELRSLLGDLNLDGEYATELNNLENNINNLQSALDKVWMTLYDIRKGV